MGRPRHFVATMGMPIRDDGVHAGQDVRLLPGPAALVSNVVDVPNGVVSALLPEDIFQG